jgi:hypothetical protein
VTYAVNRGATLSVDINDEDYVFMFADTDLRFRRFKAVLDEA